LIETSTTGRVAAFIAEYIQGVGGSIVMPDGYLEQVYKTVREAKGVLIADEVQTGFGRLGTKGFWGFEHAGVQPDIVTMAKGIGNGIPLAAVATTQEISQHLKQKLHFNTYGGNPVSMAVGRAVLKVIDEEKLQQNSEDRGRQLISGLKELQSKYPGIIGDVRGKGLMVGMEMVRRKGEELEPASKETADVFEGCKERGLLVGKGGFYGNVFRLKPPMCINAKDVDFVLQVLDDCLKDVDGARHS